MSDSLHRDYQTDLDDAMSGYREWGFICALDDAMRALRERRLAQMSNGGPPVTSERDEQRKVLNAALKDYGWRVVSIPGWRQREFGFGD